MSTVIARWGKFGLKIDLPKLRSLKTLATTFSVDYWDETD